MVHLHRNDMGAVLGLSLLLGIVLCSFAAHAATDRVWQNDGGVLSGDWDDTAHWVGGNVPDTDGAEGENAVISADSTSDTYTVTLDDTMYPTGLAVNKLTVSGDGAVLDVTDVDLTTTEASYGLYVTGNTSAASARIDFDGGSVTTTGLNLTGGTPTYPATLTMTDTSLSCAALWMLDGSRFTFGGTGTGSIGGSSYILSGATMEVTGGTLSHARVAIAGSSWRSYYMLSGGSVAIAGFFSMDRTGGCSAAATAEISGGSLTVGGTGVFGNTNPTGAEWQYILRVNGGAVDYTGTTGTNGVVRIGNGGNAAALLDVSSGTFKCRDLHLGNTTARGYMDLSGGTTTVRGALTLYTDDSAGTSTDNGTRQFVIGPEATLVLEGAGLAKSGSNDWLMSGGNLSFAGTIAFDPAAGTSTQTLLGFSNELGAGAANNTIGTLDLSDLIADSKTLSVVAAGNYATNAVYVRALLGFPADPTPSDYLAGTDINVYYNPEYSPNLSGTYNFGTGCQLIPLSAAGNVVWQSYAGTLTGDWNDENHWVGGNVPDTGGTYGEKAVISPNGGTDYTVALNDSMYPAGLDVTKVTVSGQRAKLVVTDVDLTTTQSTYGLYVTGNTGAPSAQVGFYGGSLTTSGISIDSGSTTYPPGLTLTNTGLSTERIWLSGGGQFVVNGAGTSSISSHSYILGGSTMEINSGTLNTGSMYLGGGNWRTSYLIKGGTMVTAGHFSMDRTGGCNSACTLEVSGGSLSVSGPGVFGNKIPNGADTQYLLRVNGGAVNYTGTTGDSGNVRIGNAGSAEALLDVSSGSFQCRNLYVGSTTGKGRVNLTGGTTTVRDGLTLCTDDSAGTGTDNGTLQLVVASGATLTLNGAGFVKSGSNDWLMGSDDINFGGTIVFDPDAGVDTQTLLAFSEDLDDTTPNCTIDTIDLTELLSDDKTLSVVASGNYATNAVYVRALLGFPASPTPSDNLAGSNINVYYDPSSSPNLTTTYDFGTNCQLIPLCDYPVVDLKIASEAEPTVPLGDGLYLSTPAGVQDQAVGRETSATMTWNTWVENDGDLERTFLLKATGASGSGWTVTYKSGATDITSAILGAGYTTTSLEGDESEAITVEVTPDGTVSAGTTKTIRINVYLDSDDADINDSIQGSYTLAQVAPDLLVRANSEAVTAYAIDDTYQATPSGDQVESRNVDGTVGDWYRIKIENDGAQTRGYRVKGTGASGSGWTVVYKAGANDKTSDFTSANGYTTKLLAPGEFEIISVKITPDNSVSASTSKDVVLEAYGSPSDSTVRDSVKCTAVATGRHGWYAATNGTAGGDGTIGDPWDIQTALNHPGSVDPGDTIWLRGGTYGTGGSTVYYSRLEGTSAAPITVRSYTGEWAIIDGSITEYVVNTYYAEYVIYRDFEIMNSSETRKCENEDRPSGLSLFGPGDKAVNLIIHDTGHPGIGYWRSVGDDGDVNGCVLWADGLYDLDTGGGNVEGSGIYSQNQTGTRYITNTISFRNFTTGFKMYSAGGSWANNFHVEGNTCFDTGSWPIFAATATNPIYGLELCHNNTYQKPNDDTAGVLLGLYAVDMHDATVQDNYLVQRVTSGGQYAASLRRWLTVDFSDNTVVGSGGSRLLWYSAPVGTEDATWNDNSYHNVGGNQYPFQIENTLKSWSDWKSDTGFDADSTCVESLPVENRVAYRQSTYRPGRTNVTIYNWQGLNTITLDLTECGVEVGDSYEIRDAQNYFGTPIVSGICGVDEPDIPMGTLTTVAQPIGNVAEEDSAYTNWQNFCARFTHTAPEFGVFVVIRTNTP